jgi:dihydrofolate synthase/folylpolyglutamate synthase
MNYPETLEYLYAHLPMFSRLGTAAMTKDLSKTIELCAILENPENKFKSIHIAGTNGKGSTSHMLAAILQLAGYKTGLYTSPHLKDFRERIRINGEMISEGIVIGFVKEQQQHIEEIEPSFFEVTVGMAFEYFAKQAVDIAVIEVGLGGRLDSTNIITPLLSVITNIGFDHMNLLGNTLPEIAAEKAGIIKTGIPVVIGERKNETADVFIQKAKDCRSEIRFASDEWDVKKLESVEFEVDGLRSDFLDLEVNSHIYTSANLHIQLDLAGSYQTKNLATVLSAVEELRIQGFNITEDHIKLALKQVQTLTGLHGRWETLSRDPLVICDTGHNEDGILEVLKNISEVQYDKLHMVIGMLKDKDIHKILALLPQNAIYYFCSPDLERAKPSGELKQEAADFGLYGQSYPTVAAALEASKQSAGTEDLIFIGGSTFVVAEII